MGLFEHSLLLLLDLVQIQLLVDLLGLVVKPIGHVSVLLIAVMVFSVVVTSLALLDRQQLLVLDQVRS